MVGKITEKQTIEECAESRNRLALSASEVDCFLERALKEDLGLNDQEFDRKKALAADITSSSIVPQTTTAVAQLFAKEKGVIAGLFLAERVFQLLDPTIQIERLACDGQEVSGSLDLLCRIRGNARAILSAERTAVNLVQRLSGIATYTSFFAKQARQSGITVLDTRKTTPGMRALEKYAVLAGGGTNHRFGLFDAILIKDNHISVSGGITAAIGFARQAHPGMPLEVEVTNRQELEEALSQKAEKILLDNMTPEQIQSAVLVARGRAFLEVSGGVNESNFSRYLIPGVNAISIGALTHSATSLDISLEIEMEGNEGR